MPLNSRSLFNEPDLINKNRPEIIRLINREFYKDKIGLLQSSIRYLRDLESSRNNDLLVFFINILLVLYPRNKDLVDLAYKHSSSFYTKDLEEQLQYHQASAVKYLKEITRVVPIKSIIDFGTGPGAWLRAAHDCGIGQIIGIEKHYQPKIDFEAEIISQDVCEKVNRKVDLIICIEVAEHIHPEKSQVLINNLTECGDLILFGAASERQSGDGHINCRKQSFWSQQFFKKGYRLVDFYRSRFWNDPAVTKNYVQNTFLFVRENSRYSKLFKDTPLLDIDHPELINPHYLNDHRKKKIMFENIP